MSALPCPSHPSVCIITFTERGFIIHKVIYKLREDLKVLLVFPSKRGITIIKKCVLYFLLIFFFFGQIYWECLRIPYAMGLSTAGHNFFSEYFFSYGLAHLQIGKIVCSLRTMSCGSVLYKPAFSSLLTLYMLFLLLLMVWIPYAAPPPPKQMFQLADDMGDLDGIRKLEIRLESSNSQFSKQSWQSLLNVSC